MTPDPRTLLGAVPIPGDLPSGSSIRYEPDFTALQDMVVRMDTEGPMAVDWRAVVQTGCTLLETRSKDLLIAAWVTLGLARTESWHGLSTGLAIIAGMVEHHWPLLEPPAKRERARVQMLEWTVQRVAPLFADQEPDAAAWPDVVAAYASLQGLEEMLDAKLTKESASLGELGRLLRERARDAERGLAALAPPPAPVPPPAAPVSAAPASAPDAPPTPTAAATSAPGSAASAAASVPVPPSPAAPSPGPLSPAPPADVPLAPAIPIPAPATVAAPASSAEVDLALSRLQATMQDVARGVQSANPADPRGYALLRAATWLPVAQAPMQTNGVTPLPPPPPERLAYLAKLQAAGDHAGAVAGIEQTFAGAPFWLDAHRMACTSLQALGPTYDAARLAVTAAAAGLLHRLPVLLELSFSNRVPLADDETRAWLAAAAPGADGAAGGGVAPTETDPLRAAAQEARKRAAAGSMRDGLAAFRAGAGAASGRERFLWRLAQAEFCLDASLVVLALPLLDHLDAEVGRAGLESWEPGLAAQVSVLMHRCLMHNDAQGLRLPEARAAGLETHRARLSRLDIVAASEALKIQ